MSPRFTAPKRAPTRRRIHHLRLYPLRVRRCARLRPRLQMHRVHADTHREQESVDAGQIWRPECAWHTHGVSACMESDASTCTATRTPSANAPLGAAPLSPKGLPMQGPPLGQHNSQRVLARHPPPNRRSGSGAPTRPGPAIRGLPCGPRAALTARPHLAVHGPAWGIRTANPTPLRASPHRHFACGISIQCRHLHGPHSRLCAKHRPVPLWLVDQSA